MLSDAMMTDTIECKNCHGVPSGDYASIYMFAFGEEDERCITSSKLTRKEEYC